MSPRTDPGNDTHDGPSTRCGFDSAALRDLYPFRSHHVDLGGGVRMHHLDEGGGEPILLLHGNPTWSFFYRNVVLGLRDRWRLVAPDHVGCGFSDKPASYDYTLATHIENVQRLADALALDRITLVVHDWGGPIGLGFAARDPGRIRRLVVMNTAAYRRPPTAPFPDLIRSCRMPLFGDFAIRRLNLFVKMATRWTVVKPERMTPAVRAGYLAPYGSYADRIGVLRFVQDIPFGPSDPAFPVVERIEAALPALAARPVLFLWGMKDFCFTPHYLDHFLRFFPSAEVERLSDAGHYLLEDAHERIVPRLRRFLEEHPLR